MSVRIWIPLLFTAAASAAHADAPRPVPMQAPVVKVTCDFLEITASIGKAPSIDGALKHIEKNLKKTPWKYNQFKLLSQAKKSLVKGQAEAIKLKLGSATATLVETVDKSKIRLSLSENHGPKRVLNTTTTIAAADWFITGHPVKDDGHLLAVSCK